jgi:hypothetical protein
MQVNERSLSIKITFLLCVEVFLGDSTDGAYPVFGDVFKGGAGLGAAFAKGGGQSLPEFVRNCRLDYACRLMVEQPDLSFVQISEASGFQRTTTFYHDFKARFGMAPAEYRERELKVKSEE